MDVPRPSPYMFGSSSFQYLPYQVRSLLGNSFTYFLKESPHDYHEDSLLSQVHYKYLLTGGLVCTYLYVIYQWLSNSFFVKRHVSSEFSGLRRVHGLCLWMLSFLFLCLTVFMYAEGRFPTRFVAHGVNHVLLAFSIHSFLFHSLRILVPRARPTLYHSAVLLNLFIVPVFFDFYIYPFLLIHRPPMSIFSPFLWAYFAIAIAINIIPWFTPRVWYPLFPEEHDRPSEEQTCTYFSYICSYYWLNRLISIATRRTVEFDDAPQLPDYDKNKLWSSRYERLKRPSLYVTMHLIFAFQMLGMATASFFISATQFISPVAMNRFLKYLENPKADYLSPYVWIALLLLGPFINSMAFQSYLFLSTRYTVRSYSVLVYQIYKKVLDFRFVQNKNEESKVGRVNNLISTDANDIGELREFIHVAVRAPFEIGISVYLLQKLLGWSAYIGLVLAVLTTSVPILLGPFVAKLTLMSNKATDSRIELMSELLQSIRVTKFFGWERPMLERVQEKRRYEIHRTWKLLLMEILIQVLVESLPFFSMFVTFILFTTVMGQKITPSIAFTSISLFNLVRNQFAWISHLLRQLVQIFVSIGRISDFLHDPNEVDPSVYTDSESEDVGFDNATFTWPSNPVDGDFRLRDLNFKFPKNQLSIVVGPTGSGKTSLISALLGELSLASGSYSLPRSKGVSYVSQVAWLRNATVKDNILFNSIFDETRYRDVLKSCGLQSDLENLPAGDLTEIGEKGVTLSGGQKQRIALARAVYAPSSVVLIDDVMSALDIHTSNWIFRHLFQGPLMQNRTVILVTHSVNLFLDDANFIVTVKNGSAFPTKDKSLPILQLNEEIAHTPESTAEPEMPISEIPLDSSVDAQQIAESGKLVEDEKRATGDVPMSAIFEYFRQFGSGTYVCIILLLLVVTQTLSILIDLWVAFWTNKSIDSPDMSNTKFLFVYGTMLVLYCVLDYLRTYTYDKGSLIAAKNIHNSMLKNVFGTYASWFNKTPTGRIVNRFAKDIRSLDLNLPSWLFWSIECFLSILAGLISVSSAMPLFLIPAVIICSVGFYVGVLYTKAQVGIKRLISVHNSPIFGLLGESISGLAVIRAFNMQSTFRDEFSKRIDNLMRLQSASYNLNRWVAIRTDGISGLVGGLAGFIALKQSHLSPGLVGFSLNQSVMFSVTVLYFVRSFNNLQAEMNSYERVKEYTRLEQEPAPTKEGEVPVAWPKEGDIKFENVSVSYTPKGSSVIENLNLHIHHAEKVAIVGRTGSGKSTLGLTLLRFTHRVGGSLRINDLEIENVNLSSLRQRISFIPQDPILFSGTVRSNLDPFNELDECLLNEALQTSGANKMAIAYTDDQQPIHITLDTQVSSEGSNFSQGQKQVLALARAIVRRSKIIILDECTASVDDATDQQIQKTLRSAFGDVTMLCIAHRLKTIVDYHKVMVMDKGVLVEYGPPGELYNKGGVFRQMCEQSAISFPESN
ncbi:vacuolar phytochelatin and glutathione S-conjugate ABC family transmembrane transporter Abc4 [Schizosaccharomyces osmophilus]|uniref:Vacuolar phytochelatin and glutathione S-conjugate ABC family transmembrane transporter Abc4 n=1 Tax=Schizosaccharomyces osmophilus TaxID=2545709 RepID=A0AAE9WED9_9SCHI|nr:vacuolar phytochelatin and glutathione S-conjugate ABC family transmembrane transporter Abc4 [Schizosaccharomyces osmophilus]WBW74353.1 vacuolar phytochelatin and glutathione S-conjugate ABC family transmembrane transporter Abc4 [Schizosaccharomyces osmophilus]